MFAGDALSRKLLIAKEERDVQVRVFNEIRDTIPSDAAEEWVEEVAAWEKERKLPVKSQTAPNPYVVLKNGECPIFNHFCRGALFISFGLPGGVTEAQVRLQLRKEETDEVHEGRAALHETSATGFLTMGLHIEHLQ